MFTLPREMVAIFYEWVQEYYGTKVKVHDKPTRGEHARFMIGEAIFLVREHSENADAGATLEVWGSNENRMEEMGTAFEEFLLVYLAKENEDEESDNE